MVPGIETKITREEATRMFIDGVIETGQKQLQEVQMLLDPSYSPRYTP